MEPSNLEVRWIVLGTDGRYVTVSRHSEPPPDEIFVLESRLSAQGMAGWLTVMKGRYHESEKPVLMMVRALCNPQSPFADAVAAFQSRRIATLETTA
jgi:hypothetical protein